MKQTFTLLTLFFFISISFSQEKVSTASHKSWINYQEYNKNPEVNSDEITQGTLMLLADYQVNIPSEESYFRYATKITDNVGIQSASNINVLYDPLYQKLTFHSINIIRGTEIINKLNPDHFQVIRRELNAENYLYDGSLSAMLNLSDVRNGDIIDFSYTIKGFNPIHEGKFSNTYYLNDYVPIGKVNLIINSKKELNYKNYKTTISPEIIENNGLKKYRWTTINPKKTEYETNIPQWKLTLPTIIISDYKSWEEVVNWGINLYNVNTSLDKELQLKIEEIDTKNKTEGEKIKAVLQFVQNDIRYLGLEYGIGSYKPNPPNKVFKQRYGDCKDKSLLMVSMLKSMNINAYPMFVSTYLKHTIKEILASPVFFDHCVVKVIDGAKNELYYDPTMHNQGGNFSEIHFPNYEYGLVIKDGNSEFDTIVSNSTNLVTTNEEFILEEVGKGATLNISTVYSDVEADNMRNYFANNSMSGIIKEYENYYANYYSNIKSISQPVVTDNKEINEFKVVESYKIDSIWKPMPLKKGYIAVEFTPSTLSGILQLPNIENRKHEIQLPYPVSRQHNTIIKLPQDWDVPSSNELISNDAFYYDTDIEFNKSKKIISLKNYLKVQKPYVSPKDFRNYSSDVTKLDNMFGFTVFIPKDSNGLGLNSSSGSFEYIGKMVFYGFIAVIIILFIVWLITRRRT